MKCLKKNLLILSEGLISISFIFILENAATSADDRPAVIIAQSQSPQNFDFTLGFNNRLILTNKARPQFKIYTEIVRCIKQNGAINDDLRHNINKSYIKQCR